MMEEVKLLREIHQIVYRAYQIPMEHIYIRSKKEIIIEARQVFHYLSCRHTRLCMSIIGDYSGYFNHATVLNSRKTIKNRIDTELRFRVRILGLSKTILERIPTHSAEEIKIIKELISKVISNAKNNGYKERLKNEIVQLLNIA